MPTTILTDDKYNVVLKAFKKTYPQVDSVEMKLEENINSDGKLISKEHYLSCSFKIDTSLSIPAQLKEWGLLFAEMPSIFDNYRVSCKLVNQDVLNR